MLESYELVELYELSWGNIPLGEIRTRCGSKGRTTLALGGELNGLRFDIMLVIGPRGGVHEEYIVMDPAVRITADRLLAWGKESGFGCRGKTIDLPALRQSIHQGADALQASTEALSRLMAEIRADPTAWEAKLRALPSLSQSVGTVYPGGLPGLGSSRGASGQR